MRICASMTSWLQERQLHRDITLPSGPKRLTERKVLSMRPPRSCREIPKQNVAGFKRVELSKSAFLFPLSSSQGTSHVHGVEQATILILAGSQSRPLSLPLVCRTYESLAYLSSHTHTSVYFYFPAGNLSSTPPPPLLLLLLLLLRCCDNRCGAATLVASTRELRLRLRRQPWATSPGS